MPESQIEKAIALASTRHGGQWRDEESPLPYVTHVVEVLANLRYIGGVTDEEMWCAAALHDLLEETDTEPEEIEKAFGPRVAGLVQELTRTEPSEEQIRNLSKDEVRELRSKLLLADIQKMSPEAKMIKLADRLSNLRQALVTRKGKKLARYKTQTEAILQIIPEDTNPNLHRAIKTLL